MEKPVCVDAASARQMLELNEKAKEKNLKVAVGLMCRHCVVRKELFDRIKNGEMGDINLLRAYRCKGREATCFTEPPIPRKTRVSCSIKSRTSTRSCGSAAAHSAIF